MKNKIKKLISGVVNSAISYRLFLLFESREKRLAKTSGISLKSTPEEELWCRFWYPLTRHNNRYAFRLYSASCGKSNNVICEPAAIAINKALNPPRYRGYYADKNMFNHVLPATFMPKTIMRRMNGILMDCDYNMLENIDSCLSDIDNIIVKPSTDTSSGVGVLMFKKGGDGLIECNKTGHTLNEFIKSTDHDFIIQEAIVQHPFMAQFNNSSVNTIRIATYRSVIDNKIHILSSVIRMGINGSVADNLHMGGRMVGVNEDGTLANFCADANGVRYDNHNTINFKNGSFRIPNYDNILSFAKQVAQKLDYCRLVQHDICLDLKGNPVLIEYNVSSFSAWIAQFTGKPAFGEFAKEMRDFALKKV